MKGNIAFTPSWNTNKTIYNVRIGVDRVIKSKNKDTNLYEYESEFFDVKFFKDRAHQVADMNLGAGDLLKITGDYQISKYITAKNPDIYNSEVEILGRTIELLFKKNLNNSLVNLKDNSDQMPLEPDVDITKNWKM